MEAKHTNQIKMLHLKTHLIGTNNHFKVTMKCLSISLILLCLVQLNEGQFFTKSSSKSIPRMGRRSVGDENELTSLANGKPMSVYRRSMIDALIDEYGPSLLQNLQRAKAARAAGEPNEGDDDDDNKVGEIPTRNDQPFDVNPDEDLLLVSRGQRSQQQQPQQQYNDRPAARNDNYQDLSLALRALNTKRYLQQLSSGQPLAGLLVGAKMPGGEQQHSDSNNKMDETD